MKTEDRIKIEMNRLMHLKKTKQFNDKFNSEEKINNWLSALNWVLKQDKPK